MKKRTVHAFVTIFCCASQLVHAQSKDLNYPPSGICQAYSQPLSKTSNPEIKGRLCNVKWKDIQTSPNSWNWSVLDKDLADRTKDGLPVIFMIFTGPDAPTWLYSNGVPKVDVSSGKKVIATVPFYADSDYKTYFKRMITQVHQHIESLNSSVRNNIVGIQPCFGSTGDYISYHGDVASQYNLSDNDFSNLFKEFTGYYYDEYKNTSPKIRLMNNPNISGETDAAWLLANCPGNWLKSSSLAKGFQLSQETGRYKWLFPATNTLQDGEYVKSRSENSGPNTVAKWWVKQKYKNIFAVLCYDIYWGLDWPNFDNTTISDSNLDSAYSFFNKYAGQKDPSIATNAVCVLKDALDAADGVRFPSSSYGNVSVSNLQRFQKIANDYASYGALLEDPQHAMTTRVLDNIAATGTNDVSWQIFPGNWDRYLHQINANATSAGYWNVQSNETNTIYGRFARGFDLSKGKNALYFDLDDKFLNNKALNSSYPVVLEITYLDKGQGSWKVFYDAQNGSDKLLTNVNCSNTLKWKKLTITINDAYFNNRGKNGADFYISNSGSENVIFTTVEISRPDSKTINSEVFAINAINAQEVKASATNPAATVYPNPAKDFITISFESKSNQRYTLEITDMTGKSVFRKQVATQTGINTITQKVNQFVPGLYLVNIVDENGNRRTTKLVKK